MEVRKKSLDTLLLSTKGADITVQLKDDKTLDSLVITDEQASSPFVITHPGEYEVCNVSILLNKVDREHNAGTIDICQLQLAEGINVLFIINDIELNNDQLKDYAGTDILVCPFVSITSLEKYVTLTSPKTVIVMDKAAGVDGKETLEKLEKEYGGANITRDKKFKYQSSEFISEEDSVIRFNVLE